MWLQLLRSENFPLSSCSLNVQYAPKYTVLKLAHLERACAFIDGA
jgi:hypothetical protein